MDDYVKDTWLPTRKPPKAKDITGKVNENNPVEKMHMERDQNEMRDDYSQKSKGYSQSRSSHQQMKKSSSDQYQYNEQVEGRDKSSRSSVRGGQNQQNIEVDYSQRSYNRSNND